MFRCGGIDKLTCLTQRELETQLMNAEFWILARYSYSSVSMWLDAKREIEKEMVRRSSLVPAGEVWDLIWNIRDENESS